jgi:hypothetical protein
MAIRDNNFVLGDPTDGVFNVADANNIKAETDNYIDTSSQTKSESDLFQMAKTGAVVASKGDFYKESAGSAADVYLLEADDDLADVWRLKNGMRFRFKVVNANTGASTVNINSLGAKDLKILGGDLSAGDLSAGNFVEVVYNESLDYFELQTQRLLPKQITISNGTDTSHDIDFTAGSFDFDDQSGQATLSAITKQIDAAWAEGTNAGGLDTGTVTYDTFYYLFAIYNPTTQTSDALFSESKTSPTLPSGYTKKKYVGSVLTDGGNNLVGFRQIGNLFRYTRITFEDYIQAPSTTGALETVTVPPIDNIVADLTLTLRETSHNLQIVLLVTHPDEYNYAPSYVGRYHLALNTSSGNRYQATSRLVSTSSLGQVRYRVNTSDSDTYFAILTNGYFDYNL